jgi:hypothetical protein
MARTIRHAGLTAGACMLLAGACATPALRHQQVREGLTFTIRTGGTSFDGRPLDAGSIPTQILGRVLRFDFPSRPDPTGMHRATPEVYMLVDMTAKTTIVVMPAWKQYLETPFDSAVVQRTPSTTVSDIDVSGTTVGKGEIVSGFATTRYRITSHYTETLGKTIKGEARKKVHVVDDVWVPDALKDVPDPVQVFVRVFQPSGMVSALVEKQADARRKLFTGLPIRTTWVYTQTFDGGSSASKTSTIDIVDLRRTELDPAAFRVPDGYRRLDLAALLKATELFSKSIMDARKGAAKGRKTP